MDNPTPMDPTTGLIITWFFLGLIILGGMVGWMTNIQLYRYPADETLWYTRLYLMVRRKHPPEDGLYLRAARFIAIVAVYASCTVSALGIWGIIQGLLDGWLIHGPPTQ